MGLSVREGRCAIVAAIVAGGVAAAPAAAADAVVHPCRAGTPAHAAARRALDALDAAIRTLEPAADPGPLTKRLTALNDDSCFRIIGPVLHVEPGSGLGLRTWWEDGGQAVAAGALALGGDDPMVWVGPDIRRALTRETAPEHRLAPLLCPAYDETCGHDTDRWRLRAKAALERATRARNLKGDGFRYMLSDWKRERPPTGDDCPAYARKVPRHRQLIEYQNCLDTTAPRTPAFPIGRIRKPTEGWLVVSGRRGHYTFCDELRAFDLATGSTYRLASCSGLALVSNGSVDHRATDAARKPDATRGTVSLDKIREAAWMLLQLGELDERVLTSGFGRVPPKGMPLESDGGECMFGLGSGSLSLTSAQTSLDWRVVMPGHQLGDGAVTWPRDLNDDAEAYATDLLQAAEDSFKPGCPPAVPPPDVVARLEGLSAHHLDADAASLGQAASALGQSWRDLLRETCARVTPRTRR